MIVHSPFSKRDTSSGSYASRGRGRLWVARSAQFAARMADVRMNNNILKADARAR